jgi:hypothetical protein
MYHYPVAHRQPTHQIAERLSATANLGFVPLPDPVIPLLASYVAAPHGGRIMDPCAGEGVALGMLAAALGLPASSRYANELHDGRAAACRAHAAHVVSCDALKSLQGARRMVQLAYLNPPFGHDGAEEGGGRLEPKFFRRLIEDATLLQEDGIAIYVTPQDILARPEAVTHLARCFDDITLVRLPDDLRQYREAIMLGVYRARFRSGAEARAEAQQLQAQLSGDLPVITFQSAPRYTLPMPVKLRKLLWQDASRGTPTMSQQDVIQHGCAWRSKKYRQAARVERTQLRPMFPLHKPQAALRIAAGAINGMTVAIGGVPQTIKGSTKIETLETVEEIHDGDKTITETHRIERRVPHIVTMDETGSIRRFVGDKGLAALMHNDGTADALLHAVEESAPPIYQLDMEPEVQALLAGLKPASGRHLPGYAPGLLPMQQHLVAALYRRLTTPDAGWHGATPTAAIAAAEMGVGKTTCGIALAEVMRCLAPTNT